VYFEGSSTEIGPDTGLLVQRVERSPSGNIVTRLVQTVGTTVNRIVQLADPGARFEVETPAATAIVRGTDLTVRQRRTGAGAARQYLFQNTTSPPGGNPVEVCGGPRGPVTPTPTATSALTGTVTPTPTPTPAPAGARAATCVTVLGGQETLATENVGPGPVVPRGFTDQFARVALSQESAEFQAEQAAERQQERLQQQAAAEAQARQAQAGLIALEVGLQQLVQQERALAQQILLLLTVTPTPTVPRTATRTPTPGGPTPTPGGPTPTPTSSATLTLTGQVVNAVNVQPIAGASVSAAGQTTTTDASGNFRFAALPAGPVSVTATASGFLPGTQTATVPAGGTANIVIALSPTLPAGQFRIVLTWGATPRDLDSHLWVPTTPAITEVYFGNQGSLTAPPFAELDTDDVTGFGPETITIAQLLPGTYTYAVHNFSQDAPITSSGAQVQVFGSSGSLGTFSIPTSGTGIWWTVFTFNGSTLTPVNTISNTPPLPSAVGGQTPLIGAPPTVPQKPPAGSR
jgi:hypothetical protein